MIEKEIISYTKDHPIKSSNPLREWLFYFLRKWYVFLIVGLLLGAGGAFYAYTQKPKFESRLTFTLAENSKSGISGALSLASELGFNIGGSASTPFSGDNIIEIIKSKRILEGVLLSEDTTGSKIVTFAEEYLDIIQFRKDLKISSRMYNIHYPVGIAKKNCSYLQDSVLFNIYTDFSKTLSVKKIDKKLDIYEIKLITLNEKFTKKFTDAVVSKTIEFYTDIKSKQSKQTLELLEQRAAQIKGSLNSSIAAKATVQDANLNPAFIAAQVPLQTKQVDIAVYGAAYTELFKNIELARFQYLKDIPLLQIIDNADYPMRRIKLGRLNTALFFSIVGCFITLIILTLKKVYFVVEK